MEDLLYQYNPWWEGAADFSVYRPRPAQIERISKHLGQGRAVFLVGMRRAGKTTLLRLLNIWSLKKSILPKKISNFWMCIFSTICERVACLKISSIPHAII